MRNARLGEAHAGIQIAGRNINNLRYADDTTLMAESKEELKSMDPTETEDVKKRWQEYTEEQYKKDLHDPVNHDGMITHLEPDILECKVKWTLGSITI